MIATNNIRYSYDGVIQMSFPDITVDSGQSCLILGPSGCGKTTLLHIMAGIIPPKSGSVQIAGKQIHQLTSRQLSNFRGNHIGVVYQIPHFIAALTMEENLMMAQKLGGRKPNPTEIRDYFNELEIGNRVKAKPSELSQGELQRASMIRGIINEPDVVLADEPTSALDDDNAEKVLNMMKKMTEEHGSALVIVTHDQRIKDKVDQHVFLTKKTNRS